MEMGTGRGDNGWIPFDYPPRASNFTVFGAPALIAVVFILHLFSRINPIWTRTLFSTDMGLDHWSVLLENRTLNAVTASGDKPL